MIFTPLRDDFWYAPRQRKSPDKVILDWEHSQGEFSLEREEAFEKHLKRINYLNKFFSHLNGQRVKKVAEGERLWFGMPYIKSASNYGSKDTRI